jgi:NAD(P)-dependent dehydrogenase (short-subunit alcohol dehydrogenase family)
VLNCDLASADSVKDFGKKLANKVSQDDLLINNAANASHFQSHNTHYSIRENGPHNLTQGDSAPTPKPGIYISPPDEDMSTIKPSDVLDHFNTNVVGTLLASQAIAPLFRPGTKVVNVSSIIATLQSCGNTNTTGSELYY